MTPRVPLQGEALLMARKLRALWAYRSAALARKREAARYLLFDREVTNFTYDLENTEELATFLARAFDRPLPDMKRYLAEVEDDDALVRTLEQRLRTRRDRNPVVRFGRRVGWYAIVRILKPSLVVETGVHDGLGSALLLRALERNGAEGGPGELLGFDVDPRSGWLLGEQPPGHFRLVVGDTRETLGAALGGREVGVFIHDSLHTYEHERFEYSVALRHSAERLALISDNAHATSALQDLCRERGAPFAFFRERPLNHFYPGAGIGLGLFSR